VERLEIFKHSRDKNKGRGNNHPQKNRNLYPLQNLLGGRVIKDGSHSLLVVEHRIKDDTLHQKTGFFEMHSAEPYFMKVLFPGYADVAEDIFSLHRFLFLDIETNGLSGGAGTCAFLVGVLEVKKEEVVVTQYFLPDLSSERFFLEYLSQHLEKGEVLVSFNGKCFDLNIIKNRFILNGMRVNTERFLHLDLLHTSRRMWKGLCSDFTLSSLERSILGVNRKIDIPSYMIPQVYFDYLRGYQVTNQLYRVFIHNRDDVLSLFFLLLRQVSVVKMGIENKAHILSTPEEKSNFPTDRGIKKESFQDDKTGKFRMFNPVALSRMLVKSSFVEEAIGLLNTFRDNPAALKILALLCKQKKKIDETERVLKLFLERVTSVYDYIFACTELAKIYEHVKKEPEPALRFTAMALKRVTRTCLLFPDERWRMEKEKELLEKRLLRLERKLAVKKGKDI